MVTTLAHCAGVGSLLGGGTNQVACLRQAIRMVKVLIETQLIPFAPQRVQVEMRIYDERQKALKSFCWMGFVHFDLRSNSVNGQSTEYMGLFVREHQPSAEKGFEERLAALRRGQQRPTRR